MRDNGKDSAGPIAQAFNPWGYAVAGVSIRFSSQVCGKPGRDAW